MHWLDITLPVADVLGRAVRHHLDLVALLEEAEGELQAGLAGADDQDLAHVDLTYSISLGIAGSACSGPMAE